MFFGAPRVLFLLLLLPVAALLYWNVYRYSRNIRARFQGRAGRLAHSSTHFRYFRLSLLFTLACACLIAAAAEPEIEQHKQEKIYDKVDVIFILDTSLSMRARDIAPSRRERAREVIQHLLLHKGGGNLGRIGLVSFAGSSIIQSYLTDDPNNINYYLDNLASENRMDFGTDIASGLNNALQLVQKERTLDESIELDRLIFILVSDGEDHGEPLRKAVQKVVEQGIRIYTVGFGSQMGGYIPVQEKEGQTVYLKDDKGKLLLARFDEETLRWVAEATGGQYYRSYSGSELYESLNRILQNERRVVGFTRSTKTTSLYYWLLLMAIPMLFAMLLG